MSAEHTSIKTGKIEPVGIPVLVGRLPEVVGWLEANGYRRHRATQIVRAKYEFLGGN